MGSKISDFRDAKAENKKSF